MFHNLSCYDAHLFIKTLRQKFNGDDTGVITENKEKYISVSIKINVQLAGVNNKEGKGIRKIIWLDLADICRFMLFSLDKMDSNLDDGQCKHLKEL